MKKSEGHCVVVMGIWRVLVWDLSKARTSDVPSDHFSIHPPVPQVKSGTIFDNFLITNDEAYAEEFGNETWGVTKVGPGSGPGLGGVGRPGG